METRTELILLQRTMVVVEGVARSLNPRINIWEVAGPVVERYIRENVGPAALARDLLATARVADQVWAEAAAILRKPPLIRQMQPPVPTPKPKNAPLLIGFGILLGVAATVCCDEHVVA